MGNLAVALPAWEAAQLPALSRTEAVAELVGAFDLAESQTPGHSARIAYLATAIADRLGVDATTRQRILVAALLHDSGIAVRATPDDGDTTRGHTAAGAWAAAKFGYDRAVQEAILSSHERWDGMGRPRGLAAEAIPIEALAVAAAHWASDEGEGLDNLLIARSRLRVPLATLIPVMGPRVAEALHEVLLADSTWIAMSARDLASSLARPTGDETSSTATLVTVAKVFGEIIDTAAREPGRSERVATLAVALGRQTAMPEVMLEALAVAGYLADLGLLGVPRHITDKPAILTVQEMETMQRHASGSARIVEALPGMDVVAHWIEAHHERMDGRGYPEMLEGEEIPLPARILAVADTYSALRAERPYRDAFGSEAALDIIGGGAGPQFDPAVVAMLPAALAEIEASAS
jgi:putative nucleotidyltransferase with HDIG domain